VDDLTPPLAAGLGPDRQWTGRNALIGQDDRGDVAGVIEIHTVKADDPVVVVGLGKWAAAVGDIPVVRAGAAQG